jgi:hypothetical protein
LFGALFKEQTMNNLLLRLAAAGFLLTTPVTVFANKTYSPLPSIVFTGKTVFIENETGDASLQHLVYLELARWGRYEVAPSREKAEIVISISGPNTVRAVPTSETSGGYPPRPASDVSDPVPAGMTRISIVDPKTGKSLWFSQRKTDISRSHTSFLDGLRDAMDQQESRKGK